MREQLPPGNEGAFDSSRTVQEAEPMTEKITPDVDISTKSPLYIYYAANYDLDPMIQKLYPEGKRQYLNSMLKSIEAGQNEWPDPNMTSRAEALTPMSEQEIRKWFSKPEVYRQMKEAGYENPDKYLQEILQIQEESPQKRGTIRNTNSGSCGGTATRHNSGPESGRITINYIHTRSMLRDEVLAPVW